MKKIITPFLITAIILFCLYGMYWIFKTVSYVIFYESMVKNTIQEMVKEEYLK
jgi:hypothetical protein